MKINKFGGSILKNAEDVKLICQQISDNSINIFSAFKGTTDLLIEITELAKKNNNNYKNKLQELKEFHRKIIEELKANINCLEEKFLEIEEIITSVYTIKDCSAKVLDNILIFGEIFSTKIIHHYFEEFEMNNKKDKIVFIDSTEIIKTNSAFGDAKIEIEITKKLVKKSFLEPKIYFMPGYIASDLEGNPTTLGRNGSDYTASLVGSILKIEEIIIWKDVDGIFTGDPKIIKNCKQIDFISYREMFELSYFGTKAIALQALYPTIENNTNIRVRNLYNIKNYGSLVSKERNEVSKFIAKGITKIDDVVLISIYSNKKNEPAIVFSAKIFNLLERINIDILFFNHCASNASISLCVKNKNSDLLLKEINEEFKNDIKLNSIDIKNSTENTLISIIGEGVKNFTNISNSLFSSLTKLNLSTKAISYGLNEINITTIVETKNIEEAMNLIHDCIFLN